VFGANRKLVLQRGPATTNTTGGQGGGGGPVDNETQEAAGTAGAGYLVTQELSSDMLTSSVGPSSSGRARELAMASTAEGAGAADLAAKAIGRSIDCKGFFSPPVGLGSSRNLACAVFIAQTGPERHAGTRGN